MTTVVVAALADGRYAEVAAIARLADGLIRLVGREEGIPDDSGRQSSPLMLPPQPRSEPSPKLITTRTRDAKHFPRFEREDDRLVKIAWSKSDRCEYEHKAPYRVVNLLVDAIRSKKGEGSKFTAPDVLPLFDLETGSEVPSYQAYLVLAWLRYEGIIVKYGRDTYSLKPTAAAPDHVGQLWEALPSRH